MVVLLRYGRILIALALLAAAPMVARAAAPEGARVVEKIRVEGNEALSTSYILSVLGVREGSTYDVEAFRKGLKKLFGTKKFAYLELKEEMEEGVRTLVLEVREYPLVQEVVFTGNKKIDAAELEESVAIGRGAFGRPGLIQRASKTIQEKYQEKGYYGVQVSHKFEGLGEGHGSRLVFGIVEGEKVSIKHIDFFGNMGVDSDQLRGVMESKEDRWWRGADFKPQQLGEDLQRVLAFYKSRGYLDAQVTDHDLRFSNRGKDLDIFIYVEEGARYYVGGIDWSGNTVVSDEAIRRQVNLDPGNVFDQSAFQAMVVGINNLYWEKGYIYSSVNPQRRVQDRTIHLDLRIVEGEPAYVNEIRIVGNTKTHENVIRRVLTIKPGDTFSNEKVRRSLMEVFRLGYFAGPPTPDVEPTDEANDIDLVLNVEEKQTGKFNFGAGFSALNSLTGFFSMTENNFMGRGQTISFNWEFSRTRKNFSANFTEPWMFGTPTHFGVTVFNQTQNRVSQQFYDDRRRGFNLQLGRPVPWIEFTRAFWTLQVEEIELRDFDPAYTGPLRDIDWPQRTTSLGLSLVRDSGNRPLFPTAGSRSSVSAEFAGGVLGGDVDFQKYRSNFTFYQELIGGLRFKMSTEFGLIDVLPGTESVPDYEKFRLGGNRRDGLRGYDFYDVVPRGNPVFVGGRFMNINSYELVYPFSEQVYLLGFLDAGNTWNSFRSVDFSDMRRGAGLGLRVEIPLLGLIGFDYGYGFDKPGGGSWEPHLTMGGVF
jgi:outer membrane protein insertion porin family